MKLTTLAIFCLLLLSCSSKQHKNSLANEKIKGNVKSVVEYSYTVYDDTINRLDYKSRHSYDKNGNEFETINYNSDGNLNWKTLTFYNKEGAMIEEDYYKPDGLRDKFIYHYDANEYSIGFDDYFGDSLNKISKTVDKNDVKGHLLESDHYNYNGTLAFTTTYKYDAQGNQIEMKMFQKGNQYNFTSKSKYDSQNNETESEKFNEHESLMDKTLYKYDSAGVLIEIRTFDNSGHLANSTKYKYEYDATGNWLLTTAFINDVRSNIIRREIVYY